jgi:hypothetical protein
MKILCNQSLAKSLDVCSIVYEHVNQGMATRFNQIKWKKVEFYVSKW